MQAIAAEELARASGAEGMDEDESNIKYEITRKHFEEGLAGTNTVAQILYCVKRRATSQSLFVEGYELCLFVVRAV